MLLLAAYSSLPKVGFLCGCRFALECCHLPIELKNYSLMEHLKSGGFYFLKFKTQYLEFYKFRCSLFLSFWVPVKKKNCCKNLFSIVCAWRQTENRLENNCGGISMNSWAPWPPYPRLPRENLPSCHSPPSIGGALGWGDFGGVGLLMKEVW